MITLFAWETHDTTKEKGLHERAKAVAGLELARSLAPRLKIDMHGFKRFLNFLTIVQYGRNGQQAREQISISGLRYSQLDERHHGRSATQSPNAAVEASHFTCGVVIERGQLMGDVHDRIRTQDC